MSASVSGHQHACRGSQSYCATALPAPVTGRCRPQPRPSSGTAANGTSCFRQARPSPSSGKIRHAQSASGSSRGVLFGDHPQLLQPKETPRGGLCVCWSAMTLPWLLSEELPVEFSQRWVFRLPEASRQAAEGSRGSHQTEVPPRAKVDAPGDQVESRPGHPECENHIPRRAVCHNLRWAMITMTAPTKAANTVGNIPPPAETPRAIQPPTTLPIRPSTISPTSPYPPSFITKPVSQPSSTPTTTHHPNIPKSMTLPPSH